jgi:tetratricopeptide (TPR) repeat protein
VVDVERRRGRAERHRRRSVQALQKGDFAQARKHGYLLLEEIGQVHAADPGNPEDTVVEAGALYNMAAIEDQLGRTAVAIECARKALELYAGLGVVGSPAEIALAAALEAVAAGFVRPPGVPPLTKLAASAADARARLARLLAKASGPAAAQEVRRLGADAVETYERIIATGHADMDGLRYVVTQYAVARDTLARGYLAAGERDRAVALYQDVQTDCERALGVDHPVTAAARSNLTAVRR